MAAKTIKLWGVLAAMLRTFGSKRSTGRVVAGGVKPQAAFGSQATNYGISSALPPMR